MKIRLKRCWWPVDSEPDDQLMVKYHDTVWGVPVHNDRQLFEYLVLDSFQAGLSWRTILHKQKNFRKAFDNFDYKKMAKYDKRKVNSLLKDAGIIRNRQKIEAAVRNARAFMEVQQEFGSFDKYIWQFTGRQARQNKWKTWPQVPATSKESDAMSVDLKKRGFAFVGSTICYAFMQGVGIVNDHLVTCFRHKQLK